MTDKDAIIKGLKAELEVHKFVVDWLSELAENLIKNTLKTQVIDADHLQTEAFKKARSHLNIYPGISSKQGEN